MDNQILIRSSLQIIFSTGIDPETGKPSTRSKTFNNIKTNASGAGLYAVARAFETVQKHPIYNMRRVDTHDLAGD